MPTSDATLQKQIKNGVKLYWLGIGREDFFVESQPGFQSQTRQIWREVYLRRDSATPCMEKLAHLSVPVYTITIQVTTNKQEIWNW